MRCPIAIVALASLLCSGCDKGTEKVEQDHRWFNTYQTDRTCQMGRPFVHDEDIKGPTGRAHPF